MNSHVAVLAALGGMVCAFAVGEYQGRKPARVEYRDRVVEHTDTSAQEQIRSLTAQLETAKRDVHREIVTVTRRDGTRERHETVDSHQSATVETHAEVAATREVHTVETREVVRERVVTGSIPQWHVGAMAQGWPGVQGAPINVGVTVSRRILGPFFLGVNATLPVDRPDLHPSIGASLSLEF